MKCKTGSCVCEGKKGKCRKSKWTHMWKTYTTTRKSALHMKQLYMLWRLIWKTYKCPTEIIWLDDCIDNNCGWFARITLITASDRGSADRGGLLRDGNSDKISVRRDEGSRGSEWVGKEEPTKNLEERLVESELKTLKERERDTGDEGFPLLSLTKREKRY